MKAFVAVLLSALLGIQLVWYAFTGSEVYAEEITEETEETGDTEEAGTEKAADESGTTTETQGLTVNAPSAILMEASTGKVIYEKDADTRRAPASVTKIMTLLLIFDAITEGKISLEDEVQTSEYAASMGGSQVFLEEGEIQTVDTLIKCIAVASANDACVAMAEYISGSEEAFVGQMNERAKELGMEQTTFKNCNGLDEEGHETTARDIALMSRELLNKYPQIHDYSMIWMENITHTTSKGSSEFGLTNTNKLVRQYQYATGLKTGSTANAKFCVSATAEKNQIELIAVVMAAENSKSRFQDATVLLNYGFGICVKYMDEGLEAITPAKVSGGVKPEVSLRQAEAFEYIDTAGADLSQIKKRVELGDALAAPVKEGDKAGEMVYLLDDREIGRVDIVAAETVDERDYIHALEEALEKFFM